MNHIRGNDIFADVPPPIGGKGRQHASLKAKDMYGSVNDQVGSDNSSTTTGPASGDSTVFSTPVISGAKFSPGYATRRIADNKKRDLYGSDIFGSKISNSGSSNGSSNPAPTSFVVEGLETIYSAGRPNRDRITGGGPVQIRLG